MSIALSANSTNVHESAVVFAADERYFPFALFAAWQIARLHPERDFDICICSSEAPQEIPASLATQGFRSCQVDVGAVFSGLNLDARRTEAAYLRLALPAAFAGQYKRLLYLDADVFVQGGNLSKLLGLDLAGTPIAAVRDNIQWRTPTRRPEQFRMLGLSAARYFNSGLLVIDVDEFDESGLLRQCLEFAHKHEGRMIGHDQNLLNCVLHGRWAELHPAWNWQYTRSSMLFEAMETANIVHFIGAKKPWNHVRGGLPLKFRQAYRNFFDDVGLTGLVSPDDGASPHENRSYLRKVLVRHVLGMYGMCRYLDRFDSRYSVLS